MDSEFYSSEHRVIEKLFAEKKGAEALVRIERLLAEVDVSIQDDAMRLYRAGIYELGLSGEIDHVKAIEDYEYLHSNREVFGDIPALGLARVLLKLDPPDVDRARDLYREIMRDGEYFAVAAFNMGQIEEQYGSHEAAAKWYLDAFLHGNARGLRKYAEMQLLLDNLWRSGLAIVLAFITRPLLTHLFKDSNLKL